MCNYYAELSSNIFSFEIFNDVLVVDQFVLGDVRNVHAVNWPTRLVLTGYALHHHDFDKIRPIDCMR
jgi:hypothetical protein